MNTSHFFKTIILWLTLCVVLWFVFGEWDCDVVLQWWFDSAAIDVLWEERVYYTTQQLEFVDTSLNTFCCTSGKDVSKDLCDEKNVKRFWNEIQVVHSPYYFDHFKFFLDLQIHGVAKFWDDADTPLELSCDQYEIDGTALDCTPYIYTTYDLPSPMICHRNGADSTNGWDTRCDPSYDVMSWVDTLSTSLDISSPSQYRWLFDKFWTNEENILPPKPSDLTDIQAVKDLRFMQLGRLMCEELTTVYSKIIWSTSFYEKTLLAQWGTISQRCQRMIQDTFKKNAWYLKANAYISMEQQSKKSNWAYRDHMYDNLNAVLQSMSELVAGTYQMLKEMWNEYTNVCSV